MKKITFLFTCIVLILTTVNTKAQIIDVQANWPNPDWNISGNYTATGFVGDPRTMTNFSFDDDLAGSGSLFDIIDATSPVINLTAAIPTEQQLVVSMQYVYRNENDDELLLQWFDNDNNIWEDWDRLLLNSTNEDYKSCSNLQTYTSPALIISTFTPTQLAGFRYRIRYNDAGFGWGFCIEGPEVASENTDDCFAVTDILINPNLITTDQIELDWTDNNAVAPQNDWEIEYGPVGFTPGTGTIVAAPVHPFVVNGLMPDTSYDFYVRALCEANGTPDPSSWSGPETATTLAEGEASGCFTMFTDTGGLDGNYSSNELYEETFCPENAGDVVSIVFTAFNTENGFDYLRIYDGTDINAPLLGEYDGTGLPPTTTATNATGCLTVQFDSDGSVTRDGWEAFISCGPAPTITCDLLTNITFNNITLNGADIGWTDNNTPAVTAWEMEIVPLGTALTGIPNYFPTTNPFTVNDLDPTTAYTVIIRSLCDDNGTPSPSIWTPAQFSTLVSPPTCDGLFVDNGGPAGDYPNNENETYVICPDNAGDVVTIQFTEFDVQNGDSMTIYDGNSIAGTLLGTFTGQNLPPILTSSDATGCLTVVFQSNGDTVSSGWSANVICSLPPTCIVPSNLVANLVTYNSVTIQWDENNTPPATAWNYEVVTSGTTPTGTGTPMNTNPFTIGGLNELTAYDVYIQTDCGGGDTSFWLGPLTIETPVTPPLCGGIFMDSGGPNGPYSNNELETWTICPDVVGEVVSLQFLEFNLEAGWDDMTIYNGPNATGTPIGVFDGTNLPPLISSTDTSGCLTIVFDSDGSVTRDGWLANILCAAPPTCFVVEDLTIDNILTDTVTISWTDPLNDPIPGTEYTIEYGPVGFVQGTGTEVPNLTNPGVVTGLNPQTEYDFYVQANCDVDDDSFWVGPIQATTLCEVFTAPYVEDFEDGGAIDICWSQGPGNGENWLFGNDPDFTHIGNGGDFGGTTSDSGGYYAWVDDSGTHNTDTELYSPLVDVSALTVPAVSFYYISHDEGQTHVDFSVDVWDGAAWNDNVFFTNNTNTNGWEEVLISLDFLTITGPIQVRFVVDENNGTDFYDDIAIDDVRIDEAPTCFRITDLAQVAQTTNTVDVTWVDNNNPSPPIGGWTIEIGLPGFEAGVGEELNSFIVPSTATFPYQITGLIPSTTYQIFVRANCAADDTDSSLWAGPLNVNTQNAPPPNDACIDAIELMVTLDCEPILANNILATSSTDLEGEIMPDCADPAANGDTAGGTNYDALDIWYYLTVPSTGTLTIQTSYAGLADDTVLAAYTGTCGNLVELECSDTDVIEPNSNDFKFSSILLRNLTPGDIIYIRVWTYDDWNYGNLQGQFGICAFGQSRGWVPGSALDTSEEILDNTSINFYPNPVNDVLNVTSDKEISNVSVYTILGQQVINKVYNGVNDVELNVNQLSQGTYFVKANVNGEIKTFKMVKN